MDFTNYVFHFEGFFKNKINIYIYIYIASIFSRNSVLDCSNNSVGPSLVSKKSRSR